MLSIDFEAEAREVARLHFVIDEEADADGKWNDAGGRHDEQHTQFQNGGQKQPKEDDASTRSLKPIFASLSMTMLTT